MASTTGTRPILALDVDDVLNPRNTHVASRAEAAGLPPYKHHLYTGPTPTGDVVNGEVLLNPAHGAWLRDVADAGVEIVWATSWGATANACICPVFGLPELPVIPISLYDSTITWGRVGKFGAVCKYIGDRPLVWVDNAFGGKDLIWAEDRTAGGIATLIVHVDPAYALTLDDIASVDTWLDALRARAAW
ncbi:HAD domain-containing protein [Planomonospora sp. ID82291]|uniref:HAD domain-containing protein n=1 Tax=Planomonospora sp. ID82291 TaxID=2738136 RepID=UPI0018C37CC8|nr:HAD domain-containing protein [Planomonospora sp. ID82291]MBG0818327.1 hypothetical protein [Planomonospora sp. ID82291]